MPYLELHVRGVPSLRIYILPATLVGNSVVPQFQTEALPEIQVHLGLSQLLFAAFRMARSDAHLDFTVECQNLTIRMQLRRFTRLTNAFSKKLSHLKAAVHLHLAFYDFRYLHPTLRIAPAMEAGLTDHDWAVAELLGAV
jgi:hypothetical protein